MPDSPIQTPDVMLLAAGLGKRLLPLTAATPKPLVEVAGQKLIDRVIANARAEGLFHFVVNAHYHADQIVAHVQDWARRAPNLRFRLSVEPDAPLNTGGGVKQALPLLDTDPILVMNTDAFWPAGADQPIGRMLAAYAKSPDIVLLCAQPRRATGFRRSHDFCLDPLGTITNDTGAPVIYAGVALIPRHLIEAETDTVFSLYRLFDAALEAGTLKGVVLDAPWLHVGDPEALVAAEAALRHE